MNQPAQTKITAVANFKGSSALNGFRVALWYGSKRASKNALLRLQAKLSATYHSFQIEAN